MSTERGFCSCDGTIKHKLKVVLVIGCANTLCEANVYSHYNKTNKYVTGINVLKLGPDDDLDEVETCRPCKLNS